jgi:hypothetical protein
LDVRGRESSRRSRAGFKLDDGAGPVRAREILSRRQVKVCQDGRMTTWNFVSATALALLAVSGGAAACGGDGTGGSASTSSGAGGTGGMPAAPYTIEALDAARITSDSSMPNYQKATADIELKDGPFASVTLHVTLASTCYPFDGWKSDPPPAGQNWPADCDAFDRNFETSLHDPAADPAAPGVELVRAITPFGGPMQIDEDITDYANGLQGKRRLEVVIPTYSDGAGQVSGSNGGWNVTVSLDVVPGTPPRDVLSVEPLYYASDTDPAGPGPLTFHVPEGTASGRIDYRATGHGGAQGDSACIGPAEEFCKREHHISVDGAEVQVVTPWRTDCKDHCTLMTYSGFSQPFQYCAENPCGAIQSVKAPRANWCPGTETAPFQWDMPTTAGAHTFAFAIPALAMGGNWEVSATYIAYGP